jgi:plasmid stability protein
VARLLVKKVDPEVVTPLKARAREGGRSLQAEIKLILERTASTDMATARSLATRLRRKLRGRHHTDSVRLLARDRMR